jgi:uncharacterized membrane protein YcaP (DUF421 family)
MLDMRTRTFDTVLRGLVATPESLAGIVIRTVVVYLALTVGLRVAGKRELGQMTSSDLVVVLVISNAVQNAMVGPDVSLLGGLVAAGVLLALNSAVDRARLRWRGLNRRLVGDPTLLVVRGEFIGANLRREGMERDEVLMAMREHGFADLANVEMAMLEVDGTISIVPVGSSSQRTRRKLRGRKPVG